MTELLRLSELDRRLSLAAERPSTYDRKLKRFASECDRKGLSLEGESSDEWKSSLASSRTARAGSLEQLFRNEVAAIEPLDREGEARLARRIEFARLRLERAL